MKAEQKRNLEAYLEGKKKEKRSANVEVSIL